jgi:integrase
VSDIHGAVEEAAGPILSAWLWIQLIRSGLMTCGPWINVSHLEQAGMMATSIVARAPLLTLDVTRYGISWTQRHGDSEMPLIFWSDGSLWSESALWARHKSNKSPKTVVRAMDHLASYARWLETEGISWLHFPEVIGRKSSCLDMFRGALVKARNLGELAPSTASQRMAAVIRFYRWVQAARIFVAGRPLWTKRTVLLRTTTSLGLQRTLEIRSTDLALPNRKVQGAIYPEDGLLPVTAEQQREIIELADRAASQELALMLRLGFGTGMRLGSICGLRVETLMHAQPCPMLGSAGFYRLSIGPGARPPVPTKYGVSGTVLIHEALLSRLREYAAGTRRVFKRQALAAPEHRSLVFLNRFGESYSSDRSRAVNVEMSRLRVAAAKSGREMLMQDFRFHRSRATFISNLMRGCLMAKLLVADAVTFVKEAALHRDERTTFKYVKFVETSRKMADYANEFTSLFLNLKRD